MSRSQQHLVGLDVRPNFTVEILFHYSFVNLKDAGLKYNQLRNQELKSIDDICGTLVEGTRRTLKVGSWDTNFGQCQAT